MLQNFVLTCHFSTVLALERSRPSTLRITHRAKANWLVSLPFLSSALVEPKRLERPRHVGYETTEFENRGQDSFCPRVWLHTLEPLRNGCLFDLLEDLASTGQILAGVFSQTLGKFMPLVSQSVKARKPDLE